MADTWRSYTGIAAKGYVHRLVKHSKENFVTNGNHINGLEGFWGYLKRKPDADIGQKDIFETASIITAGPIYDFDVLISFD